MMKHLRNEFHLDSRENLRKVEVYLKEEKMLAIVDSEGMQVSEDYYEFERETAERELRSFRLGLNGLPVTKEYKIIDKIVKSEVYK